VAGLALLLAATLALTLAAPAQASGPDDVDFGSGGIEGLVVDAGFTQASFQNLHYEFGECGSPHELTCTWEVRAQLLTASDKDCDPNVPATEVWSSGPQSGNGSYDSGPLSFDLLGCKGQILALSYEYRTTHGDWGEDPVPPLIRTGGGGTVAFVHLGYYPLREAEEIVLNASPAARPAPMPEPPPAWQTSADCRSLFVGTTRYVFAFKGLGCGKALRLALGTRFGNEPSGYRCLTRPGGGGRCVRQGRPGKFVEWHRLRPRAAARA
jgi:hypothetical protein